MTDPLLLPVLVRMATAATVVVLASLAAERAGPFWGAIVVSLPVSAGPAYVLLAQEQDTTFLAASALASLASFIATPVYLVAYTRLAPRHSTGVSALGALVAWVTCILIVRAVSWTALSAVLTNVVVFAVCLWLTRGAVNSQGGGTSAAKRWFDLPLRAIAVAVLVAMVVTFSGYLGPGVTGIAAIAPVATMSLALAIQPRIGGVATAATMAATLRAMPGIGFGFLVLHLSAVPLGTALGLTAALIASVSWPLVLITLRARRGGHARSGPGR